MVLLLEVIMFLVRIHFFFFNDTATTEIYTLSLHDALPISRDGADAGRDRVRRRLSAASPGPAVSALPQHHAAVRTQRVRGKRSEEHTSELQSRSDLVCRLLLEKKKREETNHESL